MAHVARNQCVLNCEHMATSSKRASSHLGAGIVIGSIIGAATGFFLQSRKGKELTKDAHKRLSVVQSKVLKKLSTVEKLSKAQYEDVVDDVLKYYQAGKEITKTEVPQVRKELMKRWKSIESHLKKVK